VIIVREISTDSICLKVKELLLQAAFHAGDDVKNCIKEYYAAEKSPAGRAALEMIMENQEIASSEEIAICQDTGMAVIFFDVGQEVLITGGDFREAVNRGVREAYSDGYLRKSVVNDPVFDRKNTGDNTPAVIYTDIVSGDKIKILALAKGFGSENMSALAMLTPFDGADGIINFVISTIEKAGPNPCPPTIVGVGIGGTADMAMVMAKKGTARSIGSLNPDPRYAEMELEILKRANRLGIGPAGLGGDTTSLAVHIDYMPTHIAGMPVAVNICCHASRHAEAIL
jgi:fumarate hydratase subunit alpha